MAALNRETWAITINDNKLHYSPGVSYLGGGHNLTPELAQEGRGEGESVEQRVLVHRLKDKMWGEKL